MENYKLLLKNLLKPKKNGNHESLNELLHRVESKALATNDELLRFFREKTWKSPYFKAFYKEIP